MSIANCVHVSISIFVNRGDEASPAEVVAAIDKIIRREFSMASYEPITDPADSSKNSWERRKIGTVEDIRVREGL